jgi:hypothetical protein
VNGRVLVREGRAELAGPDTELMAKFFRRTKGWLERPFSES